MRGKDPVGALLLAQIEQLLAQRPPEDRDRFFSSIGRQTASWRSEFLNGKRTTDSLRLVIAIAKFFRVSVGFLLNEQPENHDAATVTLLGVWKELSPAERSVVLNLANELARLRATH